MELRQCLGPRSRDLAAVSKQLLNDQQRRSAMRRKISTTSVAIELDQPLVADPEVMRNLVEHDVPHLAA